MTTEQSDHRAIWRRLPKHARLAFLACGLVQLDDDGRIVLVDLDEAVKVAMKHEGEVQP